MIPDYQSLMKPVPGLARVMVAHEVGCRVTESFKVAVVEESYFE